MHLTACPVFWRRIGTVLIHLYILLRVHGVETAGKTAKLPRHPVGTGLPDRFAKALLAAYGRAGAKNVSAAASVRR